MSGNGAHKLEFSRRGQCNEVQRAGAAQQRTRRHRNWPRKARTLAKSGRRLAPRRRGSSENTPADLGVGAGAVEGRL